MKIMFLDTETTKLIENYSHPTDGSDNFPHVTQIAWDIYTENQELVRQFNTFVAIPHDVEISESAIALNGITKDFCLSNGVEMRVVLSQLIDEMEAVDLIVCHNVNFDIRVLRSELIRNNLEFYSTPLKEKNSYCTMLKTIKFCDIKQEGSNRKKMPSNTDLFNKLFGEGAADGIELHLAHNDIRVTRKSFFKLREVGHIPEELFSSL